MAEISFRRGYDVEPAPAKGGGPDCGDGTHCHPPHCTQIACRNAPAHPPHLGAAAAAPPAGKRFEKKCSLCNFVSSRIGSAPTFCVACDSPFELKKEPAVHCAICNLQAPFVVGRSMLSFHGNALVPDTDGWSRSFFPWPDKKWRSGKGAAWPESTWLCPKDATEVAKFIAHRREPMRTEYENL